MPAYLAELQLLEALQKVAALTAVDQHAQEPAFSTPGEQHKSTQACPAILTTPRPIPRVPMTCKSCCFVLVYILPLLLHKSVVCLGSFPNFRILCSCLVLFDVAPSSWSQETPNKAPEPPRKTPAPPVVEVGLTTTMAGSIPPSPPQQRVKGRNLKSEVRKYKQTQGKATKVANIKARVDLASRFTKPRVPGEPTITLHRRSREGMMYNFIVPSS